MNEKTMATETYDDDPFYDADLEDTERDEELAKASKYSPAAEDAAEVETASDVAEYNGDQSFMDEVNDPGYDQFGNYSYTGARMNGGVFREGERVKVVGNTSGHNIPLQTVLTVRAYSGQLVQVYENHMSYYEVDLQAVPYRLEDAEKQFRKAEAEYIHTKARLDYMKETGVEELSEAAFRQHMISLIISSDDSVAEKAKKLDAIYSNGRIGR